LVKLNFDDFAGLDAAGANAHALAAALNFGLYGTQIHVPTPPGGVVGVGDIVAELRSFAAEFTLGCHGIAPIWILLRRRFLGASSGCFAWPGSKLHKV
jgi:hypothetical protein